VNKLNVLDIPVKASNKFDRELDTKENLKDQLIWQYLNRSKEQQILDLRDLDYGVYPFFNKNKDPHE
jgi:ethanolamine utilization protein EutA (predicted chaperonin)